MIKMTIIREQLKQVMHACVYFIIIKETTTIPATAKPEVRKIALIEHLYSTLQGIYSEADKQTNM